MKEITSYNIVTASTAAELAMKVNDQIKRGWQPFGNAFVTKDVKDSRVPRVKWEFSQPIVLYK